MANRFWVLSGGTGTWNATATGKWSTTSGGAAGAAVPTASDDVFFDGNSGTGTITLGITGLCRSLTTTGYNGTFTGSDDLNIGTSTAGSLTIGTGTTWSLTGGVLFVGTSTNTVTTNGKSLATFEAYITGGGSVTLSDALAASNIAIVGGTLFTNGKTITADTIALQAIDSTNRTLNLGASVITAGSLFIDQNAGGTSTITPGTSQITLTADGGVLQSTGPTLTLNRLTLAATTNVSGGINVQDASGGGTLTLNCADYLALTGYVTWVDATGADTFAYTGALHLGGTPSLNFSTNDATQLTFVANGTITPGNATLADIIASGSGSWNFSASGATIIDGGNNTGITFPTGGHVGTATGTATVSGIGIAAKLSVGSSTGSATASGVGLAAAFTVGSSTGVATVSGVAIGGAVGVGSATGIATVFGIGISNFASTGTSTGSATVSGVGVKAILSVGSAIGIATVLGVGREQDLATATAVGTATVLGFGNALIHATGTAIGTCSVQAQGNLIPAPPVPQPNEYGENILSPTEFAVPINTAPLEYGENIRKPIEYAA